MADGSGPLSFNFPLPQQSALCPGEIVVDLFAGGGGASEALKQALGVDPALAYNHDEDAIGMHAANHPLTAHHREDIWHADPRKDVAGRPVGWFHASPDCTHFSQAKGGQPRNRKIRALTWVVLKWAGQLAKVGCAPRIISLENVRQILTWGPLVAKRDKTTGRVLKMDGTVAEKGERVPVEHQQLVPDKRHAGRTWDQFVGALEGLGYVVEWRRLVAADYGAGTSRERLFLVARRDGEPIRWPEPTHGPGRPLPHVAAAECLDFSLPCPSIFTRAKPLADATLRRIARGVMRHVVESDRPYIVDPQPAGDRRGEGSIRGRPDPRRVAADGRSASDVRSTARAERRASSVRPTAVGRNRRGQPAHATGDGDLRCRHGEGGRHFEPDAGGNGTERQLGAFLTEFANASNGRTWSGDEPLRTQCAGVKGGHFAAVVPTLVQTGYGEREGQQPRVPDIHSPLGTVVAGGVKHAVAAAVLMQAAHGEGRPGGVKRWGSGARDARQPMPTVTASGSGGQAVIAAFLEQANGGGPNGNPAPARSCQQPVSSITATGSQQRLVTADLAHLSPEAEAGALRVAAFLINYYGNGTALDLLDPLDTVTTRDRLALVTVTIKGTPYVIVDIGLRMLKPHELYRAQGFPPGYIHERTADGRPLSVSAQVRMVGNSVSPPPLRAIAEANLDVVEPMRLAA